MDEKIIVQGKLTKRIFLSIAICISLSLLSYAINFLGRIGFPLILTNTINAILGIIVSSLLLKLFFQKFCSQNRSWLTYIPLALMISVLCGIGVRIVGGISPVVREIFWDDIKTENFLLGVVNVLQIITRIILTYYFIFVIETMDLDAIDPREASNKQKSNYLSIAIGAIIEFTVSGFAISSLTDYLRYNAVRITAFVLVIILLIIGVASWGAMVLTNNDVGFDNERLVKCSWCSGEGKVWKGTKGWLPCDHCGGTGLIGW